MSRPKAKGVDRSRWFPGRGPISWRCEAAYRHCRLDVDNDRDLDLVLTADESPPVALLNDRLGAFHEAAIEGMSPTGVSGLLTTAPRRGRPGRPGSGRSRRCPVQAWRNTTERGTARQDAGSRSSHGRSTRTHWRTVQAIDLDLDGRPTCWDCRPGEQAWRTELPSWARNEGKRFAARPLSIWSRPAEVFGLAGRRSDR